MSSWSDIFDRYLDSLLNGLTRDDILARWGWVEEYALRTAAALSLESLQTEPPERIYAVINSLRLPCCQVRVTNLGRVNQADEIVEGIRALLEKPGDFSAKYRAGKIPQAGITTLTQILTLARPDRFAVRNAPFTRALAKSIPFYTSRALDELGYEEYLDICRELTRVVQKHFLVFGLDDWAGRFRFLLLYALLVTPEGMDEQ